VFPIKNSISSAQHPDILYRPHQPELLRDEILADLLEASAQRAPDQPAFVSGARQRAVGIDVMSISPVPDWRAVARDYLGPEAARKLAARSEGERDAAFAHAWSEHEARLKCLGLQLAEWCDERAVALQACRCFPLALPESYVGYVALPAMPFV
jgi:hypothetical protein